MLVNFNEKKVHAGGGNGDQVVSPINVVEVSDNQIILPGINNNRGWTAAIDRLSGKLLVTLAGTNISISQINLRLVATSLKMSIRAEERRS